MHANKQNIKGSYISYFSNLVKAHGGINLAQGIPGFDPPAELLEVLSQTKDQRSHQYAPGAGNHMLLKQLQRRYQQEFLPDESEFFIVSGATEAISLIYTYLHHSLRDTLNVLAFSPAYESYIHLPGIFGNKVFFQSLDEHGDVNLDALEANIVQHRIKLVFICSPGNPWGVIADRDTMTRLCEICEKHQCYLVIDAVYRELFYGSRKPWYPTKQISPFVFYVNSFSKLFSVTGWRIGYLLAHKTNMDGLRHVHDYIGLSSPAPLQAALAEYLTYDDQVQHYISQLRSMISHNMVRNTERLAAHGFGIPRHDGGYFIWARCPDHFESGVDFAVELYNTAQTAVIPGAHFGDAWSQYIRINIALPAQSLEPGIDAICEMSSRYL
jgi:aspartate/methionine/tyrosine aminotransferase